MKKLMMAAAIVCAVASVKAGAVNWGSGSMMAPNDDGTLSTTRISTASGYKSVAVYAWESLTAADVAFDSGDLYNWYAAGAKSGTDPFGNNPALTAVKNSANAGGSATTLTANGVLTADGGTSVYGSILYILTDADDNIWWMENSAIATAQSGTSKATMSNLATKIGGGSSTTAPATHWTAASVPEPTSAMLLLLGLGALALRRRRA